MNGHYQQLPSITVYVNPTSDGHYEIYSDEVGLSETVKTVNVNGRPVHEEVVPNVTDISIESGVAKFTTAGHVEEIDFMSGGNSEKIY